MLSYGTSCSYEVHGHVHNHVAPYTVSIFCIPLRTHSDLCIVCICIHIHSGQCLAGRIDKWEFRVLDRLRRAVICLLFRLILVQFGCGIV